MTRAALSLGLVPLLLAVSSAVLHTAGCEFGAFNVTCPGREHPGHLDEIGEPDTCCFSINPCCPNPMWGREVTDPGSGLDIPDNCCMSVPCPGWDPWKGADAGSDASMSIGTGPDAGTEPDADAEPDADTDAGP
jgi:hypothetical protein